MACLQGCPDRSVGRAQHHLSPAVAESRVTNTVLEGGLGGRKVLGRGLARMDPECALM